MLYSQNKTYQLVKTTKDSEKVVMETESSCVEKALDYFYMIKPKAYSNPKYRVSIKKQEPINIEW